MARGYPDWNVITTNQVVAPGTFDRRGEILLADDFEDGLNPWIVETSGVGAGVAIVTADVDLHTQAAELTGGSDADLSAGLRKYFLVPSTQRIGFEFSIWHTATQFDEIIVEIGMNDVTNLHLGSIRFRRAFGATAYLDSAGVYQLFANETVFMTSVPKYHRAKLVIDLEALEYVKWIYDENEYDISGNALRTTAASSELANFISVTVFSVSGQNDIIQIGRTIITENEP